jgi:hypothetical protein
MRGANKKLRRRFWGNPQAAVQEKTKQKNEGI